jgi:hypothetical protein
MAATLVPRDIVCLRNISINTLLEGDDDDNNKYVSDTCFCYFSVSFCLVAF